MARIRPPSARDRVQWAFAIASKLERSLHPARESEDGRAVPMDPAEESRARPMDPSMANSPVAGAGQPENRPGTETSAGHAGATIRFATRVRTALSHVEGAAPSRRASEVRGPTHGEFVRA